jgi:uncharacterized protein (DUF983 family)
MSNIKPALLPSILKQNCPYCRKGKMFTHHNPYHLSKTLEMHKHCEVCGGDLEPEVGFYFGTGYISYGLSIALAVAWFVAYYVLFGVSILDNSLFVYLGTAVAIIILAQPIIMRLSRSIWIAIFIKYRGDGAVASESLH